MPFGGDERAVSVVVGAVLMLGILVSALAMYQASVVPNQNTEIEFQHSQTVDGDLQDLRNAIVNTAGDGTDRAVRVQLGTQYPARTWAINPPDPRGRLRTTEPRPLEIRNATVSDPGSYDGNLSELFAPHNTTSIVYEPDYSEIDGQLRTVLDHSLLYREQTETYNRTLAPEQLLTGDTISVVVLNGTLDESGTDSLSIDTETLSGPSDPVTIEPAPGKNISIRVPTRNPAHWVEEIGTTWGENNMTATPDGDEYVVIAYRGESYDLQMSRVGVGEGTVSSDDFDISRTDDGTQQRSNSTFDVEWDHEPPQEMEAGSHEQFNLTVTDRQSGEPISNASVSYSSAGGGVLSIEHSHPNTRTRTDDRGRATVWVEATAEGDGTIYGSSGDGTDALPVTVTEASGPSGGLAVSIQDSNAPINVGETYTVSVNVTNTGDTEQTQDITLETDGVLRDSTTVTVGGSASTVVSLSWQTTTGDGGEYTALVQSEDDDAAESLTVADLSFAGGDGTFDRNGDGVDSLIAFDVANDRSDDVTLTAIEIASTSAPANEIDGAGRGTNADPEAAVDVNGDGFADATANSNQQFSIGERMSFDSQPTLTSGSEARYNVGEFRNNGETVSMGGESVTVVLYYEEADGTERSVQFTIDDL
ncbi:hypothetical protein [Halovivax limisalsi]|uniref:hypothetical protein n=1 Tax=Halovivax limisalsi TaxID=1453760 RepID=UPI001FFDC66F|nr:hypothetical protein [Halovivax limisalsi]